MVSCHRCTSIWMVHFGSMMNSLWSQRHTTSPCVALDTFSTKLRLIVSWCFAKVRRLLSEIANKWMCHMPVAFVGRPNVPYFDFQWTSNRRELHPRCYRRRIATISFLSLAPTLSMVSVLLASTHCAIPSNQAGLGSDRHACAIWKRLWSFVLSQQIVTHKSGQFVRKCLHHNPVECNCSAW